jgi:hypothetical protein
VFAGTYKKAAKFRFRALLAESFEPEFNGAFYPKKEKKKRAIYAVRGLTKTRKDP